MSWWRRGADRAEQGGETTGGSGEQSGAGRKRPYFVSRHSVLRRLTALYDEPRYLEVGVQRALTFDKVPAHRKVAVDPAFLFDHTATERQQPGVTYHQVTSDAYFADLVGTDQFDVIYLDGLHTFEQTLRDLLNALDHLQPSGVVVVDDTRPPNARAAIREEADFEAARLAAGVDDRRWSGDTFKLVWFVATFLPRLEYATIANNHGQTVFWRRPDGSSRQVSDDRLVADIGSMTYDDLDAEREVLQGAPYSRIRRRLCDDLGLDPDRRHPGS